MNAAKQKKNQIVTSYRNSFTGEIYESDQSLGKKFIDGIEFIPVTTIGNRTNWVRRDSLVRIK